MIGLVGLGYWGKIILNNLEDFGEKDISICDIYFSEERKYQEYNCVDDYKKLNCDYVFISTPTTSHFEICKFFLEKKVNVFCEKPLTISSSETEMLYDIAIKNNVILFTDWLFTFNTHIETIKKDYESGKLGKIRSIFMNRLNYGPERFDVNARWDLASHDVSIILYIFSEYPKIIKWIDYKRNKKSYQCDSSLGLIEFEDFIANINVSWYFRKKVRECIFEFDKYFVIWDDFKQILKYENSGKISYPCKSYQEPLKKTIKNFFSFTQEDLMKQKQFSIDIVKILEEKAL